MRVVNLPCMTGTTVPITSVCIITACYPVTMADFVLYGLCNGTPRFVWKKFMLNSVDYTRLWWCADTGGVTLCVHWHEIVEARLSVGTFSCGLPLEQQCAASALTWNSWCPSRRIHEKYRLHINTSRNSNSRNSRKIVDVHPGESGSTGCVKPENTGCCHFTLLPVYICN